MMTAMMLKITIIATNHDGIAFGDEALADGSFDGGDGFGFDVVGDFGNGAGFDDLVGAFDGFEVVGDFVGEGVGQSNEYVWMLSFVPNT